MTPQEQDTIDYVTHFIKAEENGIKAEINANRTVMKAKTANDIAKFNDIGIIGHICKDPDFYKDIQNEYPLFRLVMAVEEYSTPHMLWYNRERVLIAEYDDFVIGVAPAVDTHVN